MHLKDAQEVLNKPGKISEIVALGCKCNTVNRVEEITAQLEAVLPEAKVTEQRLNAIAREDQRNLVARYYQQSMKDYDANRQKIAQQERAQQHKIIALLRTVTSFITPLIVLVCAAWVGLLALANVRERRTEIGLLRALGKGSLDIASLFLGKALLLGLLGGLVGCSLGYGLARWLALAMFEVAPANFTPQYGVLAATLFGAPLISAMASYLPTLTALTQDPAVVLQEA
jgi:ABC-type lipoprotein release transport system permease subunit